MAAGQRQIVPRLKRAWSHTRQLAYRAGYYSGPRTRYDRLIRQVII